jgi:hypothetical protein
MCYCTLTYMKAKQTDVMTGYGLHTVCIKIRELRQTIHQNQSIEINYPIFRVNFTFDVSIVIIQKFYPIRANIQKY